jgi:DNA cross-link repair 1A protein
MLHPSLILVHIVYLQEVKQDALSDYLAKYSRAPNGFTNLIGLRPTGWTYAGEGKQVKLPSIQHVLDRELLRKFSPAGMTPQRDSTKLCLGFGVPYSEHSSFFELTCFALTLE